MESKNKKATNAIDIANYQLHVATKHMCVVVVGDDQQQQQQQ